MKQGMIFSEIVRILEEDGWRKGGVTGSHYHFKHPMKPGKVTVPFHGKKVEFSGFILKSILKQGGFHLEEDQILAHIEISRHAMV